jgi:hypothetical protein
MIASWCHLQLRHPIGLFGRCPGRIVQHRPLVGSHVLVVPVCFVLTLGHVDVTFVLLVLSSGQRDQVCFQ